MGLLDVVNKFRDIDYSMRIASAREYSDRSIFMERIKFLDDYDIRNIHTLFQQRKHLQMDGEKLL